jgi:hypothetical protein
MGLIESNLSNNGIGNVITEGLLAGLNTTGATNTGDPVWLGTDGNLIYGLTNKPYAPAHLVFIGIVTRINANNGEIFVKVQNGFELREIHDVDLITTTPINGHILGYNGTLWVNKTIAGWLGYTPVTNARTLTINGTSYDLSADRSWTINSMVYPSAGIAVSTGTAWGTSITDNSSNWNTAFGWGNHASAGYVPGARTLTINGTTFDLTSNRSWTIDSTSASTRTVQKYTADGSSATYTVTGGYTVGMVDVYVNGIKLDNASGVEFTATNGTTVVLVSTPASGDIVEVYKYGSQFIATNALRQTTLFTATAGQTTFTVNYSVGLVDVFYNGSKLDSSEYTASNGTTIVFNTACVLNDKVEVVAYTYNATGYTGVAYSGTPTTNYLTKWTSTGTIGNSSIFDNGTNVGIGTTTLSGSTNYTALNIGGTTGGEIYLKGGTTTYGYMYGNATAFVIDSNAVTPIVFQTNTIERMRITSTGNVGIGASSPVQTLHLKAASGSTTGLRLESSGGTTNFDILSSEGDGNVYLYQRSNYGILFGTNNTERMRLTAGGRLAIGRTTPGTSLSVAGQSEVWQLALSYDTGEGGVIGSPSANVIAFGNWAGTERMRISSSGELLIGTTSSPSAYGLVAIRGTNKGLTIQDAVSNGYRSLYFQSGNLYFYNGTNEGYLSSGGTWVNASDVTLKKDVKEIEYGLKEVMELKPKWYRMIEDDLEQIGFIAQDVEEVLPELVSTSEKGMKGLSYGQLTAVLVKAIQEQQEQISAQAIEIDNLKKLIN